MSIGLGPELQKYLPPIGAIIPEMFLTATTINAANGSQNLFEQPAILAAAIAANIITAPSLAVIANPIETANSLERERFQLIANEYGIPATVLSGYVGTHNHYAAEVLEGLMTCYKAGSSKGAADISALTQVVTSGLNRIGENYSAIAHGVVEFQIAHMRGLLESIQSEVDPEALTLKSTLENGINRLKTSPQGDVGPTVSDCIPETLLIGHKPDPLRFITQGVEAVRSQRFITSTLELINAGKFLNVPDSEDSLLYAERVARQYLGLMSDQLSDQPHIDLHSFGGSPEDWQKLKDSWIKYDNARIDYHRGCEFLPNTDKPRGLKNLLCTLAGAVAAAVSYATFHDNPVVAVALPPVAAYIAAEVAGGIYKRRYRGIIDHDSTIKEFGAARKEMQDTYEALGEFSLGDKVCKVFADMGIDLLQLPAEMRTRIDSLLNNIDLYLTDNKPNLHPETAVVDYLTSQTEALQNMARNRILAFQLLNSDPLSFLGWAVNTGLFSLSMESQALLEKYSRLTSIYRSILAKKESFQKKNIDPNSLFSRTHYTVHMEIQEFARAYADYVDPDSALGNQLKYGLLQDDGRKQLIKDLQISPSDPFDFILLACQRELVAEL